MFDRSVAPSSGPSRAARRVGAAVVVGMLATFVIGLTATPALAAVTCTTSGSIPNMTLTVDLEANDSVTLTVAAGNIVVNPNSDAGLRGNAPGTFRRSK